MANNKEYLKILKDHLRELFQFDSSDLDFGIYRIMNYKRKEIENFIEEDLIKAVEKEFEKYKTQSNKELRDKIQETENKIKEDFGSDILHNGKLIEKYGETKIVKEYLELKKQIDEIDLTESIQAQVFNDLYNFFSRYYEDGDFISKKRYSGKQHKYAIPYSGEEVKLYWANYDQYYVKTGEIFKDYEFKLKNHRFIFRTIVVDVPAGNVKGDRRYFVLHEDEPVKIENKTCIINFEYRPLTDGDLKKYPVETKGGKAKETGMKQDELNPILKDKILTAIKSIELKAILSETQDDKTILERHLLKFTRKITSDFFIHKDLRGFLERELDYFIKTEVLDIESFDTEKERYFDKHLTRAKVVKNIGRKIIEFLSQIEDFQKILWEKKKFVLRTEYVITADRIPEEFHEEIIKNREQLKEWEKLGFIEDVIPAKAGIKNKKLPVDTKYFTQEFKERLLEKLSGKSNLDDLLDGVLMKSENWQALNLLLEKYKEKVQCIYIDPPFNTENEQFIYKDNYKDSSWLSLMFDRTKLGKILISPKGVFLLHVDYNANYYSRLIFNNVFGEKNFRNEIIWNYKGTTNSNRFFAPKHEMIFMYSKEENYIFNADEVRIPYEDEEKFEMDDEGKYFQWWEKGKKYYPAQELRNGKWVVLGKYQYDVWNDIPSMATAHGKEDFKFNTQKKEKLLERILKASSKKETVVLDFFLGIGTTIAVAHKLGRKWIGIEMGDYFKEFYYDKGEEKTGILGRMKEVLSGSGNHEPCGISKEVNWQGGGFFKYHYLEQYEDTLHNIEFPQEAMGQKLLELLPESEKTEYLMKYILKFETEGSPSILDIKQFENPFEYKLKIVSSGKGEEIVNVDLVETFNYLIGLKINKYKFIQENGRKYVFVSGERNNRKTAIVWRPTKGIDLAKDKEIIDNSLSNYNPEEIFINGDSFVKEVKVIESEFKSLAGV